MCIVGWGISEQVTGHSQGLQHMQYIQTSIYSHTDPFHSRHLKNVFLFCQSNRLSYMEHNHNSCSNEFFLFFIDMSHAVHTFRGVEPHAHTEISLNFSVCWFQLILHTVVYLALLRNHIYSITMNMLMGNGLFLVFTLVSSSHKETELLFIFKTICSCFHRSSTTRCFLLFLAATIVVQMCICVRVGGWVGISLCVCVCVWNKCNSTAV